MIAVDTNILVRLLVQDNAEQAAKAEQLFASHPIFIADTVWLETEWVLRHAYQLSPNTIAAALSSVLGLENVFVRDANAMQQAFQGFEAGMDFADAWHLALSQHCEGFATFDAKLIKRAASSSACQPFSPN